MHVSGGWIRCAEIVVTSQRVDIKVSRIGAHPEASLTTVFSSPLRAPMELKPGALKCRSCLAGSPVKRKEARYGGRIWR